LPAQKVLVADGFLRGLFVVVILLPRLVRRDRDQGDESEHEECHHLEAKTRAGGPDIHSDAEGDRRRQRDEHRDEAQRVKHARLGLVVGRIGPVGDRRPGPVCGRPRSPVTRRSPVELVVFLPGLLPHRRLGTGLGRIASLTFSHTRR